MMGAFPPRPRIRFLLAVLVCSAWPGLACAQDQPPADKQPAREVHLPLTGAREDLQSTTRIGPHADKCVRFEPAGVRVTLPAGHPGERPQTGLSVPAAIQGDFEVSVNFEILQEPEGPDAGKRGTKVSLQAVLDTGDLARLARRIHVNEGVQFSTWTKRGTKGPFAAFFTTAKTGRLRLARTGDVISYYAAEGDAAEFTLLDERPFSKSDLAEIHIAASTGGPQAALDARFRDLRIRTGSLPAADHVQGRTWGRLALVGLVLTLLTVFATGVWVQVRRRRGKPTSPAAKEQRQRPAIG